MDSDNKAAEVTASRLQKFLLGEARDERRHRRVVISLPVRFMQEDSSEHRGLLYDMSPGGVSVTSEIQPPMNSRLVLYIDDIGRIEGQVVRHHSFGFAVKVAATQNRRDKIAERLTYHANRHRLRDEDLRAHERKDVDHEGRCVMPDGTEVPCRVIDLSLTGAALALDPKPPVGSDVGIGRMRGKVVRHIAGGIAIRYLNAELSHARLVEQLRR